eukprot:CAMPEP_0196687396 /NCGR_PEP_ID=MMETSP1090-20130531/14355_1 /TAXON_ID=37098 /ORGANISM="Isochrysis sp, Strain CCMP1244" /LENGTH=65 /DNA_ID=CAMNT_0042026185 /DNA_START=256 /DNA_END=450 /DNA_ORIENTATION=-
MSQQQTVAVIMSRLVKPRSFESVFEKHEPSSATAPAPAKVAEPKTIVFIGTSKEARLCLLRSPLG